MRMNVGRVRTDKEGYLLDLSDWNANVALDIAAANGVRLTENHWEIIKLLREFYEKHDISPPMRPLVKRVRETLGAEKGTSLYLLRLFPGSPAKLAAKIAGLPRPTHCL
ncbi:MAG: TusE/DsrC/DsvC family sulfur relay protein [Gammaproteobacteria bacterium]|nr:TusE/DsrC/DsvC family sulfur relay protein [Gammaproteobacteria bacterium]